MRPPGPQGGGGADGIVLGLQCCGGADSVVWPAMLRARWWRRSGPSLRRLRNWCPPGLEACGNFVAGRGEGETARSPEVAGGLRHWRPHSGWPGRSDRPISDSPESRCLFRSFHFGYLGCRDPTERFTYGSCASSRRRGRCLLRRIPRGRASCPRALRWSCNQPTEGCPLRFGMPWVRMQQRRRLVQHLDLCANECRKCRGAVDTGVLHKLRTLAEFAK